MAIVQCLENTENIRWDCYTENPTQSVCKCEKRGFTLKTFHVKNSDLYKNLNIDEVENFQIYDDWYNYKPMRVNDCYKMQHPYYWLCTTYVRNSSETFCACYDIYDIALDKKGKIHTQSLYKGLDNIEFPIKHKNITDNKELEKIFIDSDYRNEYEEFSFFHLQIKFNYILILFFVFMCWFLLRIMQFKWCKAKYKISLLKILFD